MTYKHLWIEITLYIISAHTQIVLYSEFFWQITLKNYYVMSNEKYKSMENYINYILWCKIVKQSWDAFK